MSHINRFKIVYVQIVVAFASSVGGELIGMKDLTREQLHDLTWIVWVLCIANIITGTGNTIVALFQPKPEPSQKTLAASSQPLLPSPQSLP